MMYYSVWLLIQRSSETGDYNVHLPNLASTILEYSSELDPV